MKELDVVRGSQGNIKKCLLDNWNDCISSAGNFYEVEFVDNNGDAIDALTTPADLLELVENVSFK